MIDLGTLKDYDLNSAHGLAMARNRVLRPARKERDRTAVDVILSAMISAEPGRLQEHVERLDNAVEKNDHAKAADYLGELKSIVPNLESRLSPREGMILLRSVFRLGRDREALELAEALSDMDGDAQLGFIILRVYERCGRIDKILELSDRLFESSKDRPKVRAKLLSSLINAGYTSKVFELLKAHDEIELIEENVPVLLQVARASLRAKPKDEYCIHLLEDIFTFASESSEVRLTLSRAYLQFGRNKDALDVLNLKPGQPIVGGDGWRQHVADTFLANEMYPEAGWIYRDLAQQNPLHDGWRRSGIGALLQADDHSKAAAMYEEDLMRRRISQNSDFKSKLRGINERLDDASIPAVRFDWAYQKLQQFNAAPIDRKAWQDATRRVYLADELTIDWLETRTEDAGQIVELFKDADASLQPLLECLESGKGAFVAGLHMGSMFAGPALLAAKGVNFKWLASAPAISTMPASDRLISTSSMKPMDVARAVSRSIRAGEAILVAIDGAVPSASKPVSFFGHEVLMTDIVPRTVFRTGTKSFFPKVVWVGEEIHLEFIELIPPSESDTMESYISIWFRDYVECVAEMCAEAPDNMRLAGGFWTQLAL